MSDDGYKIRSAYVEVHLKDETDGDAVKIRQKVEGEKPIDLKTWLDDPKNVELVRRKIEDGRPVKLPVDADTKQAQKAFKELTDTFDKSTEDSKSKVQGMLRSTAVGWTALGALVAGPAVAGGLALVAGGFAAIGIAAEHSAPEVTQAFNTMKTTGTDVLQAGFSSLTPVIVTSLNTFTTGIRGLSPEFTKMSAELAPSFGIISTAIVKAAQTDMPAFTSALGNATPMAHALAGGIGDVSTGFARFLTGLDFSQASQGLSVLLRDVGQLIPTIGNVLNAVMPLGNGLLSSVVPAVITLVGDLTNDLAPALRLIGSTIGALAPVLNFMTGPTASILIGIAAFKTLQATTNTLLPVFNSLSGAVTTYGNKALAMVGASDKSIGSFSLLTDAAKKQAVQTAAASLATAQQTATQATGNLATLESAAAANASAVSQQELAAARAAATAATQAETEATAALATASEASSFAFGPVGVGLAAVAGLMVLFTGNTEKATPTVENFTDQLGRLAQAGPDAAAGVIQSDAHLADLINTAQAAGISVKDVTDAINQGGPALDALRAKAQKAAEALGNQTIEVQGSTTAIKDAASVKDPAWLTTDGQAKIKAYNDLLGLSKEVTDSHSQSQSRAQAVASATAQSVSLTATQQGAATQIAKQFGLSVDEVSGAFSRLPGAGSVAVGAVGQVTSAFMDGEVKLKNAEQTITDYFGKLQQDASQSSQAVSNANHSYQQSIRAVGDAQYSYVQSQKAVKAADEGVVTAKRAVTDAVHSYEQAQRGVTQAQRGVVDAENGVASAERNLAKAQDSERFAQLALTDARKAAAEQLKSLNLQLNDQVVSEERARIKLFDQLRISANAGITPDNAKAIATQPLTEGNEASKQSALDLLDAQNSLADALSRGASLRDQVNAANKAGIEGSGQVVAAQAALKNSQEQVNSAQQAVTKSHQQVTDALYQLQQAYYAQGKAQQSIVDAQAGVIRAQDGVREAVRNEERARVAVKDAIYNEQQALIALKAAQDNARRAADLNSHSLDLNTEAGRNNYNQLMTLFNAYPAWMTDSQKFNMKVDDTQRLFGMSRDQAINYLKSIQAIPQNFTYSVTAVASVDAQGLWSDMKNINVNPVGKSKMFAEGGPIHGPGGPRDDVIPLLASAGEFMQPADSVNYYGHSFMEAVRTKRLPKYATGGMVYANHAMAQLGGDFMAGVNALTVMGMRHPAQMPAYVAPAFGGFGGVIPSGQHLALIDAALSADGIPRSDWARWEAGMNVLIQRESGWNAGIVNRWDSNAKAGHPSGGLTQTIGPTFEAYRNRGLPDNMFDGVANIAASINYIRHRYGDISRVQQANPNLPPKGYAKGGLVAYAGGALRDLAPMASVPSIVPPDSWRVLGDSPRVPEAYIPIDPSSPTSQGLLSETNARMGRGSGDIHNHIVVNGVDRPDAQLAATVASEIGWRLRMG